jgi:hypothetical protein
VSSLKAAFPRPSQKFSWLSVFLLLFTANGIFVPLRNQIISLGLIFGCGMLVLANVSITTVNA